MQKAVVTGANGFIGSSLVKLLVKKNIEVLALDLPEHAYNLPKTDLVTFQPFQLDRTDDFYERIKGAECDVFYHFAWAGSAGESRANTRLQLNNAQWTVDCVRLAKKMGCHRFIGAGSIMEKETLEAVTRQESHPGLGYIYGASKLVAHCMSKVIASEEGIEHLWGIITNAYGPGEVSPRFINTTLRKILRKQPLQFTSAIQNYDFIYIDDVVNAFYLIGEKGKPYKEYVIGSGEAKPLKSFILEIQELLAQEEKFVFGDVPFTGTNLDISYFNCEETLHDIEFTPRISFSNGLIKTFEWLKEMEDR